MVILSMLNTIIKPIMFRSVIPQFAPEEIKIISAESARVSMSMFIFGFKIMCLAPVWTISVFRALYLHSGLKKRKRHLHLIWLVLVFFFR